MYHSSIWSPPLTLSPKLHSAKEHAAKTFNIYQKSEWIGTNYMSILSSEIELVDTQDSYAPGYVLVMRQKWHTSSNILSLYFCQKNDLACPNLLGTNMFCCWYFCEKNSFYNSVFTWCCSCLLEVKCFFLTYLLIIAASWLTNWAVQLYYCLLLIH